MTNKKLFVLGVIAVLMVVLAVITSSVPDKKGGKASGPASLLQGVNADNIGSIEVKSGDDLVTLKRKQGQFLVSQKSNYPALLSKINSLISDVFDIKTVELFTDKAANHADLGVTEESAAYVVRFFKPDGSELTGVIVGRNKEKGQGIFIRLTSDDRVYVTLNQLNLATKAIGYIDQSLITIDSGEVEMVKLGNGGTKYSLRKDDTGNIITDNVPAGKKLKASDASAVFNALLSLQFNDVVKEGAQKLTFDKKYLCKMKDSTLYTISIAKDEDKTFVKCTAEFTDKGQITIQRGGKESEEELKVKEFKLFARDKAQEFAKSRAGWVYEISEVSAANLTKSLDELMEDEVKADQEKPATEKMLGPTL